MSAQSGFFMGAKNSGYQNKLLLIYYKVIAFGR